MEVTKVVAILVILSEIADAGNKYSAEKNKIEDESPFRMMKVNLIWNKARKRLDKEELVQLYQDLKHQDQLEADLKKQKASQQDEDGEFEALVTRKSLDILAKYGMEHAHPDSALPSDNQAYEPRQDTERWEKVMSDKKLSKLWKKAQLSGFSEKELGALRSEFYHHVDKVEELHILHSELNSLDKEFGNTVADFRDKQEKKVKNVDLKEKHKLLRESYSDLEGKIARDRDGLTAKATGGFKHPKVIQLWHAAKTSNFTEEELNSIKEELTHFEHKVKKLEHLEYEHQDIETKMNEKNRQLSDYPEKHYKLADKVAEYSKKVKKYETDLRQRIQQASRHNEL